jgi:predicted O-methyltransferase YrrM
MRANNVILCVAFLLMAALLVFVVDSQGRAQERTDQPWGDQLSSGQSGASHPILRVFDEDGSGTLEADEIEKAEEALASLDSNGDGAVSADELPSPQPYEESRSRRAASDRRTRRGRGGGGFANPLLAKDDSEEKILAAIDEMRRGERYANVSETDGRLLRLLTEAVGAKRVVEIGTSTGESGVWFALALRTTGGRLYTHEIDAERAKTARSNFERAGVAELVTLIEGDAHETVLQHIKPIDVVFLDADKEGYIDYLDKLLPLVRPGGLVIAHNMNRRQADPRYLEAITTNPALETAILLREGSGVGVTMKKR